ncbi:hypothetical protein BKA82DRAFT_4017173 [Pisolithus tinctorius]|nr:hypothetical protein BKA82DRAFT_4017173 [Pisolithus tinctorius]
MYPNAGTWEMISLIFFEHDMSISYTMQLYFATYEPHLVRHCKARCLQHHWFWAAGVNDIWAVDQHDKWLQFGLSLHTGIELFSGRILWMKVWHSNHNPQLILSYYLETVTEFGFILMVTQSDPGMENFGIANTQTMLQQLHDPTLRGFVQHCWVHTKKNIMLEITWMVFCWLFIPWLQRELDQYRDQVNNSCKHQDKNKDSHQLHYDINYDIIFHVILYNSLLYILIHTCVEDYGMLDFKVMVNPKTIEDV